MADSSAYNASFARVYDRFAGWTRELAPRVVAYMRAQGRDLAHADVLDLCAGTGISTRPFLEAGGRVTALDLSAPMLEIARADLASYVDAGRLRLIHGDASEFSLAERFDVVISLDDALNHLPDHTALRRCLRCVSDVVRPNGVFVFDLNTRQGLRNLNFVHVADTPDRVMIKKATYDGDGPRAYFKITGFDRNEDGSWAHYAQAFHNTVFEMAALSAELAAMGWSSMRFTKHTDLTANLTDPEAADQVVVIAIR